MRKAGQEEVRDETKAQAEEGRHEKEVRKAIHSERDGERHVTVTAGDATRVGVGLSSTALSIALATLVVVAMLVAPVGARADRGAAWRFEPAPAPAPPEGVEPAPYPVALGGV